MRDGTDQEDRGRVAPSGAVDPSRRIHRMPCPTCAEGRVVAFARVRRQVDGPKAETLWLGSCVGCARWWFGIAMQRRAWPLLEHEGWRLAWTAGRCPDPVDPLCRCLAHRLFERLHLDLGTEMRTPLGLASAWPAERWPVPDMGELNDVWGWCLRRLESGRTFSAEILQDLLVLAERGLLPFGPVSEGARAGVWCSRVRRLLSMHAQKEGEARDARRHARHALTVLERVWTRPGGRPEWRATARRAWLEEGLELVRHHLLIEDALGAARVADALVGAQIPDDDDDPDLVALHRDLRSLRLNLPDPLDDVRPPSPGDSRLLVPPVELLLGRGLWDTMQGRPGLGASAARAMRQAGLAVASVPLVESPDLDPWEAAWAVRGRLAWRGLISREPGVPPERLLLEAFDAVWARSPGALLDSRTLPELAGDWLGETGWWGTEWPWPWPSGVIVQALQQVLRLGGSFPRGAEGWQLLFEVAAGGEADVPGRLAALQGLTEARSSASRGNVPLESRLLVPWVALTLTVSRDRLDRGTGRDIRTVRLLRRTGELSWRLCLDDDEEGRVMPDPWIPPLLEAVHRCPRPALATCACLGHEVMRDFLEQSGVARRPEGHDMPARERRVASWRRPVTEIVSSLADAARDRAEPLLAVEGGALLAARAASFDEGRLEGSGLAPWIPHPVFTGEGKGLGPLDFRVRVGGQLVLEETLGRDPDGWFWAVPPKGRTPSSVGEAAGLWVETADPYLAELRARGYRVQSVWGVVHEAARESWEAVASHVVPSDALKEWLGLTGERAEADLGRAFAAARGLLDAGFWLGDPVVLLDTLDMARWHRWTTAQLLAELQARLASWRVGGRDLDPGWIAVLPWPGRWRDLAATNLAEAPAPMLRQALPADVREGIETALSAFAGLGQPPFVGLDGATPAQVAWVRRLLPGARVVGRNDLLPGLRWFELVPG